MFVRVKKVSGRRYVYIVEGVRVGGGRVRQKTLCYLGPLSKLASSGVPDKIERKADRFKVDWKRVNYEIRQIPLTFEELSEARRAQYSLSVSMKRQGLPTQGNLPRAKGELSALSRLAEARFREVFVEVGERAYRMK